MFPSVTLIIKITRGCNLRCTYCHEWRDTNDAMSLDTLEALIVSALTPASVRQVNFAWHGGEPTMVPLDVYRSIVEWQAKYKRNDQTVANLIQTNGYNLSDEWVQFLRDERFIVGVSIDGPRDLHDSLRLTVRGTGSFSRIDKTRKKLSSAGLSAGTLMVVSPEVIALGAEAYWQFLVGGQHRKVGLIFQNPPNNTRAAVAAQPWPRSAWDDFINELFDLWWASDKAVDIVIFESVIRKLLGGASKSCVLEGDCTGRYFGVDTDGTVFHCGLFEDDDRYDFGLLTPTIFQDVFESEKLRTLRLQRQVELQRYQTCPWYAVCSGGCPHDTYLERQYGYQNSQCCGWSGLIEHVAERIGSDGLDAARKAALRPSPALLALEHK
jgi:uncharacterized protein